VTNFHAGGVGISRLKKENSSFLKKRSKKLLLVWFRASSSKFTSGDDRAGAKVFRFFQKIRIFLLSHCACRNETSRPLSNGHKTI